MKKGIFRAAVLVVIFLASLATFGYFTNQNGVNLITEMEPASYPLISVYHGEYLVGRLYGYRGEMDMSSMRDGLVPVKSDRAITVEIDTFGREVDAVSYEIRSLDGERLIANRDCRDYAKNGNIMHMELILENMLEESEEYQLMFLLKCGEDEIRYYTRLMQNPDEHLDDYLRFAYDFHNDTMDPDAAERLSTYLEPDSSLENNDLNLVTINSSLQQISWADFKCHRLTDPVLTIGELNSSYAVICLDYVLTATGTGGEVEYYDASEYYRVSYNAEGGRCYLHNFERRLNQIFRADGENFYGPYLRLGIRDADVEYKKSADNMVTCFVQQGELWSYNQQNETLYRIFSFRGYEGYDPREDNDAHDIRILGIDGAGNVDFAVYGYMNRGRHEGEVGISVCHFDSLTATVEETLFIRSDKSYSRLKADMGGVLYGSADMIYCMMEGNVYSISARDGLARVLAEDIGSGSFCTSDDQRMLVWQEDAVRNGDLTVMDLETGRRGTIKAGKSMLFPIGFMEGDFIYGKSRRNIKSRPDGSVPMERIIIYDAASGKTIKEYKKNHYYISDVSIDDYVITLERVTRKGGEYVPAEPDSILNHEGEGILDENIHLEYDGAKQTQVQIALAYEADHKSSNVVTSREVMDEEGASASGSRRIELSPEHPWQGYYTYAKGTCLAFHSGLKEAVAQADEQMGVVVDGGLGPVWKRAKKLVCQPLTMPPDLDPDKMDASYPGAEEYDLTGCTLTESLYYVSEGIPARWELDDGKVELICGYDSATVWIYDPATGQSSRETIRETEERYSAHARSCSVFLMKR